MPKILSSGFEAEIANKTGLVPITFIETSFGAFSDIKYEGVKAKLISVSSITASVKLDKGGTSNELTVVLDDSDGELKGIIDSRDIHKTPVKIYQSFQSLPYGDKALLCNGYVNSPVIYSDIPRQLTFRVLNNIEDNEVGYSPEQGDFEYLANDAIGKAWPMCFGSPIRVPAVKATENIRGECMTKYNILVLNDILEIYNAEYELAISRRKKDLVDYYLNFLPQFRNPGFLQQFVNSLDGVFGGNFIPANWLQYLQIIDDVTDKSVKTLRIVDSKIAKAPEQKTNIISYANAAFILFYYNHILEEMYVIRDYLLVKITELNTEITAKQKQLLDLDNTIKLAQLANKPKAEIEALKAEYEAKKKSLEETLIVRRDNMLKLLHGSSEPYNGGLPPNSDQRVAYLREKTATSVHELVRAIHTNEFILDTSQYGILQYIVAMQALIADHNAAMYLLFRELLQFKLEEITVEGGEKFPQDELVEVIVKDHRMSGKFTGNIFKIEGKLLATESNIPLAIQNDDLLLNHLWLKESSHNMKNMFALIHVEQDDYVADRIVYITEQNGRECSFYSVIWFPSKPETPYGLAAYKSIQLQGSGKAEKTYIKEICPLLPERWTNNINLDVTGKASADETPNNSVAGVYYNAGADWGIDHGDEIYLAEDYRDIHIVSLNPVDEIVEVCAYRQTDSGRKMMPVPTRYFKEHLEFEIAGKTVTAIEFHKPLSSYLGENWEDEVFVSVKETTIGSNTTDAIKYLVEQYSTFDADAVSFAAVKTKLEKYPSNFALLERDNVFNVCENIAWQARCSLYAANGLLYIKYLSEEPAATIATLNEDNVQPSISIETSDSDNIVTKFVAEWRKEYSQEEPYKIVLRNNVTKYGMHEEVHSFFIYNVPELVQKSAQFWMFRKSNTWKYLRLTCALDLLKVEPLDAVLIGFANNYIADDNVIGVVEDLTYDIVNDRIEMLIWTPVRVGEMEKYLFAWPASAPSGSIYPTAKDLYAGR